MFTAYGPGSPREDLEAARAIAIDMGVIEDHGREEIGDLPGILEIFRRINEGTRHKINVRVLRSVTADTSPWKRFGTVVDTTEYDQQFVDMRRFQSRDSGNHWYFAEGVSPAVLVTEGVEPVMNTVRNSLEEMEWVLLEQGIFLMQPSVALPKADLQPQEIIDFMDSLGARSSRGESVYQR